MCLGILWTYFSTIKLHAQIQTRTNDEDPFEIQLKKGPRIYSEADSVRISTPFKIIISSPSRTDYEINFPDSSFFSLLIFFLQMPVLGQQLMKIVLYTPFNTLGTKDLLLNGLQILYMAKEDTFSIIVPPIRLPFNSKIELILA